MKTFKLQFAYVVEAQNDIFFSFELMMRNQIEASRFSFFLQDSFPIIFFFEVKDNYPFARS